MCSDFRMDMRKMRKAGARPASTLGIRLAHRNDGRVAAET